VKKYAQSYWCISKPNYNYCSSSFPATKRRKKKNDTTIFL